MGLPAIHNKDVWLLVAIYLFAMIIFGFMHSVLSVIFVIEAVISNNGVQVPAHIPVSIDIPEFYKGDDVDPCTRSIAAPGCAYDLAVTTLSSQLVTYAPYTVGGVTFDPPNGTMGLPYYAMKHFSDQVKDSPFEDEYRQYCLPVLDPHIISCKEEPFHQHRGETHSNLVQYKQLDVFEKDYPGPNNHSVPHVPWSDKITNAGMYKITVGYPSDNIDDVKYRTDDEASGTMLLYMKREAPFNVSVIAASNSGTSGYASLLYRLMYDAEPDLSNIPSNSSYYFVAKCEFESIKYRDNYLSSWRQVDFTLRNGVLRANVTGERCPNPRGSWTSGFDDLFFALEGAGAVLSSSDGYSKLFNENHDPGKGSNIFSNMSRLDAVVNKIYHITQTSWSESIHKYAMKNQTVRY